MFIMLDDAVCTVLPDNGTCNSDAPSVYSQNPFGDATKDYCSGNLSFPFISFCISVTSLSLSFSPSYISYSAVGFVLCGWTAENREFILIGSGHLSEQQLLSRDSASIHKGTEEKGREVSGRRT